MCSGSHVTSSSETTSIRSRFFSFLDESSSRNLLGQRFNLWGGRGLAEIVRNEHSISESRKREEWRFISHTCMEPSMRRLKLQLTLPLYTEKWWRRDEKHLKKYSSAVLTFSISALISTFRFTVIDVHHFTFHTFFRSHGSCITPVWFADYDYSPLLRAGWSCFDFYLYQLAISPQSPAPRCLCQNCTTHNYKPAG